MNLVLTEGLMQIIDLEDINYRWVSVIGGNTTFYLFCVGITRLQGYKKDNDDIPYTAVAFWAKTLDRLEAGKLP